ncbi:MAG TPA: ABC transporter ATP-binding protein, partial [Ktedonobacterales bacterium]|nr:ABC transporter ATP-binding protein [Ktedonobacterales bacterium]
MMVQEPPASFATQHPTDDAAAVSFNGLTKHFGNVRAVDHLSLDIGHGETVALLGPNGAGKTTTISMLLGLLAPDSGSVTIQGMSPDAAIQSGRIGAMLQEGSLMSGVSVGELLDFVLGLRASSTSRGQLIATAGLDGLERRRVDRLSGGQTQRLRFALAIASEPEILVLDEPTAAMDVEARHSFWANMRDYTAVGRTVLFATHYLEEAEAFASRVVIIAYGQIVADGTVADLKRRAGAQTVRFQSERAATEALDHLPGVERVEWRGESVTLTTSDSDATVRALTASDITWQDLEVHSVDLDDVFMALVGNG